MLGYLFYDQKDIQRNQQFIHWLIESSHQYGLKLELHTQEDYLNLKTPDFIINRSRFFQITDHFQTISFNSARVTKIANDKYLTYLTFKEHVKMLYTSKDPFFPSVVKTVDGHGGNQVFLAKDHTFTLEGNLIYQEINKVLGKDLRVYILDNKILTSVLRSNNQSFKSNYSLGGHIELYELSPDQEKIVYKILEILPIHYGGIDFLFDENNDLILNEIEDPVGARMLYNLTDINVVDKYIKSISQRLKLD